MKNHSTGRHRKRERRRTDARSASKAGQPPGTLVFTGEPSTTPVALTIFEYDGAHLRELPAATLEQCRVSRETPQVTWVNVSGLHDPDLIQRVGECFGLHPLTLEDILNADQRPKVEDSGEYLYIVVKMLARLAPGDGTRAGGAESELRTEQVSLILGSNYLLSFLEDPGDVFDSVRDRIRQGQGPIREHGADYLAYRLIDAVVDEYFVVLERLGDRLEALETDLIDRLDPRELARLYALKREMIGLRRTIWPMRDVLSTLSHGELSLVRPETTIFFRDVYDHGLRVIETFESYRELASGLFELFLSSQNNRMNEVMKILTIITTIFIPLSFVAGVYGMNFDRMPELRSPWGYPVVLLGMLVIAAGMLVWFRRKRWL